MLVRLSLAAAFLSVTALAACSGGSTDECTEGESQCDGDVVQYCNAGVWEDDEDCGAAGQICHDEVPAHCMDEGAM